ncbi:hypothetical protein BD1_56 [Octadecabacter Antarctic BD virus 1]|nr:hypothetical protein BD1_56 [Octadecabacter Antarctic BD virus 1]
MERITINTPATDEQLDAADNNTPHVRASERERLLEMMTGDREYEPRVGGQGQHLRCKSAHCSNTALGGARKQLCPTHYVTFLEKSNRAHAMPRCIRCNVHTNKTFRDQPECHMCTTAEREAEQARLDAARDEALKMGALDNVETTHDLREWIKEYML